MRPSFRPVSPRRAALTMMLFCAAGAALANTSAPVTPAEKLLPTEWKPWNGHHYRLETDGHLSCYSENSSKSACSLNAPDPAKAQPLRCNDPRWGGQSRKRTGYELAGHWCNTAYANLFAEWKSYEPLGFDKQLATTPRGDVMCKSADGTTCLPANVPATTNVIDPLVCGSIYKKRMGGSSTGYDDPKHWCSSREIVVHEFQPQVTLSYAHNYGPSKWQYRVPLKAWRAEEEPAWQVSIAPASLYLSGNLPYQFDVVGQDAAASTQEASTRETATRTLSFAYNSSSHEMPPTVKQMAQGTEWSTDVNSPRSRYWHAIFQVRPDGRVTFRAYDPWRKFDVSWTDLDGGTSGGSQVRQAWLSSSGGAEQNYLNFEVRREGSDIHNWGKREPSLSEVLMTKKRKPPTS